MAADSASHTAQIQLNISIGVIAFSSPTSATGFTGTSFTYTSTVAGAGTAPYTYAITGGTQLPAGLSLEPRPRPESISGTPPVLGLLRAFTITVTDSATPTPKHCPADRVRSSITTALSINEKPTSASAVVGFNFNYQTSATGGSSPVHLRHHRRLAARWDQPECLHRFHLRNPVGPRRFQPHGHRHGS